MSLSGELLHTARLAADAAARVHRRWSRRTAPGTAVDKGRQDFVTQVDREAQAQALEVIQARHPDHRILAEETEPGSEDPGNGWRLKGSPDAPLWIVDPLDGTTNFLHDHPMYAVSVGVVLEGRPVAGCVLAAATGEEWWAAEGEGAFRNGDPIRVSPARELSRALVGTGFPFKRPELVDGYLDQFRRVLLSTSGIRRGGAAALDLCYLAQGSLDAFWEASLSPWDVAGGLAVLAEAGGTWSRLDGSQLDPAEEGSVLAANGLELLEALGALVASGRADPS